jgi:hypothetical protein
MELVPLGDTGSGLSARAPLGPVELLLAQAMNPSELTYVLGAPLAHVVDYENHHRAARCEKTIREATQSCRDLRHRVQATTPPSSGQPGAANDA